MLLHFILLFFWILFSGVEGLKITKLSVPKIVDVRNWAVLTCEFDLENSKLYSVKWYKNDLEFSRFMPDSFPEFQFFRVEGVHINANKCNMTSVTLSPLEFTTSGLYTCEVSTEAPYFKTVQTAANMTVMGIPKLSPIINGLQDVYAVGDYVTGNCTSDASYPVAVLEWYINDNRVESWQLENYPPRDIENEYQLQRSTLGLNFQVDHSHFSGKGNTMILKCAAKVGEITKQAFHISKLADLDVEKFAQGLYGNQGCQKEVKLLLLWLAMTAMEISWN